MEQRYRRHILLIRLSALGDVAILQPVLRLWAEANADVLFSLAGPPLLEPLFAGMENVRFVPTRKQSPKALYGQLSQLHPDLVADMHSVLRTIGLSWLFRLHGVPVRSIHKRWPRRCPSWQRYDAVFRRCGLQRAAVDGLSSAYWRPRPSDDGCVRVGIAPFAQYPGKRYPLHLMEQVVARLSSDPTVRILLFGSRDEAPLLAPWAEKYPRVENMAGRFAFGEELRRMAGLAVMVSMDSSNMHFASCLGVPVVSVWGATHPCRGFYGWRQDPAWAVQGEMACRPCSKYGKKACRKGDYPCLNNINPATVVSRVRAVLAQLPER